MSKKRAKISGNSPLDRMFERSVAPSEPEEQYEPQYEQPEYEQYEERPKRTRSKRRTQTAEPERKRDTKQTSLMLYEDQIEWIEMTCVHAIQRGGKKVRKAELIRAMIDLCRKKGLDLRGVRSEDEIQERIEQAISS